jgi:hypothetical protein
VRTASGVSVFAEERPSGEGQKTYKGGTSSSHGSFYDLLPWYFSSVQGGIVGGNLVCDRCWCGRDGREGGWRSEFPGNPGRIVETDLRLPPRKIFRTARRSGSNPTSTSAGPCRPRSSPGRTRTSKQPEPSPVVAVILFTTHRPWHPKKIIIIFCSFFPRRTR